MAAWLPVSVCLFQFSLTSIWLEFGISSEAASHIHPEAFPPGFLWPTFSCSTVWPLSIASGLLFLCPLTGVLSLHCSYSARFFWPTSMISPISYILMHPRSSTQTCSHPADTSADSCWASPQGVCSQGSILVDLVCLGPPWMRLLHLSALRTLQIHQS